MAGPDGSDPKLAATQLPGDPAIADTAASDAKNPSEAAETGRLPNRGPRGVRPGDTLGRYELGEELGEGGMATVFRARDKELRRDVAVKVLFPHLARRDELVRRFHREARAAAGLEHENILRIYDVGGAEGDDPPYIVMEMIRGRTLLGEIEQRGPMFAEVVACVGALLADALAAAHKAQIVHRDVKPANVLIAAGGRLLLADFGVARLETEDSIVTKTGALLGTPAYMSPEQASGDVATAKSDLYSLGATLYQLATGSLPYTGGTAKVMAQIASGALVAPVKRRPAVGPDLSRIIEQLMQVEPDHRTASAAVAASELRALIAAAGFGEPTVELAAYFTDAEAFVRERTPQVVTSIVASAKRAMQEQKLPRAMALADRANALAPHDPQVTTLIETVLEGGRSSRRRRLVGIAALGVLVAGGGVAATMKLADVIDPPPDAAVVAMIADASLPDVAPVVEDASVAIDAPPTDAGMIDAPIARVRDAGSPVRRDASVAASVLDATVMAPLDASVLPVDAAAAPATGAIIIKNDTWCDVTIDGEAKGRASARPIKVDAGRHEVTCKQLGLKSWTKTVDVAPGETETVVGSLLETIDITIATANDVTIEGTVYKPGAVVQLKRGNYRIESGGISKHVSLAASCRLKADLECYR